MKSTFLAIVVLVMLLLPSQYLMVSKPIYFGYDVQVHIKRIEQYHKAILLGQFPPRLAPDIVNGTTYPLFIVNYHLPYLVAEPLLLLFDDAAFAFKAIMSASFILSGVFMFLALRKFGSDLASVTGAVVYSYLPYRFANLYFRGAFGESVAFMFIPLVLLGMNKITEGKKYGLLLATFAIFGLTTSHIALILMFLPFFLIYMIFFLKTNNSKLITICLSFLFAFLISSFQLLPAFLEKKYTKIGDAFYTIYSGQFVNPFQLFRIPGTGVNLGTHLQAGIISFLSLIFGLFLISTKKRLRVLGLIFLFLIAAFLTSPQSTFLWKNFSPLRDFIYPWRFISIIVICSSFIVVFAVDEIKKFRLRFVLAAAVILLTIFSSRHYFLTTGLDRQLFGLPTLTAFNEGDPIWATDKSFLPRKEIVFSREVKIDNYESSPFSIKFNANIENESDLIVRRLYFPGWQVRINGENTVPDIEDGLIKTILHKGNNLVEVFFAQTKLQKIANWLSLLSLFVFFAYLYGGSKNAYKR